MRADEALDALRLARTDLERGALDAAGVRLRACASLLTDADARCLCAELLLRARCEADAVNLAAEIASTASAKSDWCWKFAGHMRARGDVSSSRRVLDALRKAQSDAVLRLRADMALALGLPVAYASGDELRALRSEYLRGLGEFVAKYTPDVIRRMAPPPDALLWETFFLAYQGEDDLAPQTVFGDWISASLLALLPEFDRSPRPSPRMRPRLAFVSSRFNRSTIGAYFASWVGHLANSGWEVILAHVGTRHDALTDDLDRMAHGTVRLDAGVADNARALRAVDADMLLYPEVGLDPRVLALAALRIAPRQVCAWGHPVTTGLPTIDAFLSCTDMEPDAAQQHYRERLVTLPGLGTSYTSPPIPAPLSRRQLGLPEGRTLYLVPQVLFKFHPDNDAVLAEIVRRDPNALFVMFEMRAPSPVRRVRDRLLNALGAVSAAPAQHLFWFPECPREDYLRINLACDVMVDTLHWSGGNATLDALHCGLPIVSCPGRFMRGRQSAAMLRALDCAELVAPTSERLAEIAVSIAASAGSRSSFSQRIRANLPRLTQSVEPLAALDLALRELHGHV